MAGKNLRLKAVRVQNAISQADMARQIGILQNTYSQKENGYYAFTHPEIIRILEILESTYEDIFIKEEKRDYSDARV